MSASAELDLKGSLWNTTEHPPISVLRDQRRLPPLRPDVVHNTAEFAIAGEAITGEEAVRLAAVLRPQLGRGADIDLSGKRPPTGRPHVRRRAIRRPQGVSGIIALRQGLVRDVTTATCRHRHGLAQSRELGRASGRRAGGRARRRSA